MEAISYNPPTETVPQVETTSDGIGVNHIDYKPLYDKWNAAPNPRTDRMFEEIWKWAKESSPIKDNKDSIMWEVTKLSNRLGSAGYGEKPWSKILNYISTHNQMVSAEKRLKEMEVHG